MVSHGPRFKELLKKTGLKVILMVFTEVIAKTRNPRKTTSTPPGPGGPWGAPGLRGPLPRLLQALTARG